ncbi:DUF1064 domain-containing protein [Nitrosococcus wardiae]|uniref:DUF1064 domain-containing protein n=2 Tax=Nitrosococcus wardiae TaxID=1814290 RepID=A0A4P7C488_9GAMM|nr:DUF1064 domain-containing protein [Nitrosococcus wardiae]
MNKTEKRYAQILEAKRKAGEIKDWKFESINLQLSKPDKAAKQKGTYYRTDFIVITDCIEIHEVKGGFIMEDADLKFKIAREMYPWFRFVMMQYKKGNWLRVR